MAIEVTDDSSPFDRGQIVVMLSRTPRANLIYIVGERERALDKIWEVLCRRNCWTDYIEEILTNWSIVGDAEVENENDSSESSGLLDLDKTFPYKLCNVQLPNSNTGFVYLIVSTIDFDRCYVGETENITTRLIKHNSGHGSKGTGK